MGHVVMVLGEGPGHGEFGVEGVLVAGGNYRRRDVRLQVQLLLLVLEEFRLEFCNERREYGCVFF